MSARSDRTSAANVSDLRDSGEIEQAADVVIFLYREELYQPDTPNKGVIEMIVRKNRHGGLGTATACGV